MKINYQIIILVFVMLSAFAAANAQEILTNAKVVEMSDAKLDKAIILDKIRQTAASFDVSADALIALKKAGVADEITAAMMETAGKNSKQNLNIAEQSAPKPIVKPDANKSAAQLLREAHTIFLVKHSIYPNISELESSLLKRPKWTKFNLQITRNETDADLIVTVTNEFLTHYAFRVVDAKTNRVITASGVTSLGGALAGNARTKLSSVSTKF